MLSLRTFPFILAGVVLLFAITTAVMGLPSWVSIGSSMLIAFALLFLFIARLRRQQFLTATDPALKARAEASMSRIGVGSVSVATVDGAGRPVLQLKDGLLEISPATSHLLDDGELDALMLFAFAIRPEIARREALRYYLPWLILLVLAGVVSLYTWRPWIGPALTLTVIWTQIDLRRRTVGERAVAANVQTFLGRGGDPLALLTAEIKVQGALIRSGVNQTVIVSQLRGVLQTIARLGGIEPAEVERLVGELQAPPELGQLGARKAQRQSWGILIYVAFILFFLVLPLFTAWGV